MRIAIVASASTSTSPAAARRRAGALRDHGVATTSPSSGCPARSSCRSSRSASRRPGRRRGRVPRRGDPGRHPALRLRRRRGRARARRRRRSPPGCRRRSACSPPTPSSRRSTASAAARAQGRGSGAHRARDGRIARCADSAPVPATEKTRRDVATRPPQGLARTGDAPALRGRRPRRRAALRRRLPRPRSTTPASLDVTVLRPQEIPRYVAVGPVRRRHHRARLGRGDRAPTS